MKKILALVLAVTFVLASVPVFAGNENDAAKHDGQAPPAAPVVFSDLHGHTDHAGNSGCVERYYITCTAY